jgi:hypothetical protein
MRALLDGHVPHYTMQCLNFCSENEVELLVASAFYARPPSSESHSVKATEEIYHQEANGFCIHY